jgi:hypothetical protein
MSDESDKRDESDKIIGKAFDKLFVPTLEVIGIKLRDTVRSYLSAKTKERVAIRKVERETLERQIELTAYGFDQFEFTFDPLESLIIERSLERMGPIVKKLAADTDILRVLAVIHHGMNHREDVIITTADEMALYQIARGILDQLIVVRSLKLTFSFSMLPSEIFRTKPDVSDELLDLAMSAKDTLPKLKENLPSDGIGEMLTKIAGLVVSAYGLDPAKFDNLNSNQAGS